MLLWAAVGKIWNVFFIKPMRSQLRSIDLHLYEWPNHSQSWSGSPNVTAVIYEHWHAHSLPVLLWASRGIFQIWFSDQTIETTADMHWFASIWVYKPFSKLIWSPNFAAFMYELWHAHLPVLLWAVVGKFSNVVFWSNQWDHSLMALVCSFVSEKMILKIHLVHTM